MDQLQGFGDAIEQVMKEIRDKVQHASRQAGAIESLKAFAAAVDWSVRGYVDVTSVLLYLPVRMKSHVRSCWLESQVDPCPIVQDARAGLDP